MRQETDELRLAALTALMKVFARWAPQSRHDLVGACSPISLELALLGVKSRRAPLANDDIDAFIKRGKENVKNTVAEIDSAMSLQKQDRRRPVDVGVLLEKLARTARTQFAAVEWSAPPDSGSLGIDSEYDLTIVIWGTLMALLDRHGAGTQLDMQARREQNLLSLRFAVTPAPIGTPVHHDSEIAPAERIGLDEMRHLAAYLDFAYAETGDAVELRRMNEFVQDAESGLTR